MNDHRRKLLGRATAFGIKRSTKKQPPVRRRPQIPKPKIFAKPEKMTVIQPKITKSEIELKEGESAILRSIPDPEKSRIVKILNGGTIITDYDVEILDSEKTKITANKDLKGVIQIGLPQETRFCDTQIEYVCKTGIFRLPISLSEDRTDMKVTSFIIDGVEQLKEPIMWEVLNMYFIVPTETGDKICKYDYVEMFYKAFSGTRIITYVDPDFIHYGTELIQFFKWPQNIKWSVTVMGNDHFVIDSEKLEESGEDEFRSNVIEWSGINGNWESLWVQFDGVKEEKVVSGSWIDVVQKLIKPGWVCFDYGIVYDGNFTFCLKQGDKEYLFKSE